jgi:hypothetical protein
MNTRCPHRAPDPDSAAGLIRHLRLRPLPGEGGYFRETWRAGLKVRDRRKRVRSAGTAIYYLLTHDSKSLLHRLPCPETWHFYLGDPVRLVLLRGRARRTVTMGPVLRRSQSLQFTVPAGTWQGAELAPGGRYALLGTTMAPGFDGRDWEPGVRADLCRRYPTCRRLIHRLTSNR